MSPEQIDHCATANAYQARWDYANRQRLSLYADLQEAKALWGSDLENLFDALNALENELFHYIRKRYLEIRNPDTAEDDRRAVQKIQREKRDVMYSSIEDADDPFRVEFEQGVSEIERFLRAS